MVGKKYCCGKPENLIAPLLEAQAGSFSALGTYRECRIARVATGELGLSFVVVHIARTILRMGKCIISTSAAETAGHGPSFNRRAKRRP
jgi:hypothetical protein